MRKTLWMIGLSIALLMFGGFFVVCCIALVKYRRLNSRGFFFLSGTGYVAWMVLQQMLHGARDLVGDDEMQDGPRPQA
jgi:hypothetical protein